MYKFNKTICTMVIAVKFGMGPLKPHIESRIWITSIPVDLKKRGNILSESKKLHNLDKDNKEPLEVAASLVERIIYILSYFKIISIVVKMYTNVCLFVCFTVTFNFLGFLLFVLCIFFTLTYFYLYFFGELKFHK